MEHNPTDYLIIGTIGSTYGIKGWLKILSYTEKVANILDYSTWYVESSSGWKTIHVEDGKEYGKGVIAKLIGYNNPEQAKLLSGKKIAILKSQLPKLPKNEYYWSDLIGLKVIDQQGESLGKVIFLMSTGANDILVVKGVKEHAIPYLLGDVVKSIDLEKGEIHVDWEII